MVIDWRADHSFRVPRPDLTASLGTRDACSTCHDDKPLQWSIDAFTTWYGRARKPQFGTILAAARAGIAAAEGRLPSRREQVVRDPRTGLHVDVPPEGACVALDGDMAHPLSEIVDFESDSAEFSQTIEYPLHMGTGLAIHAWVDTDGDGIFCTPTSRQDPSGLAWQEATPEGEAEITIKLEANCRAANWFYPPPQ